MTSTKHVRKNCYGYLPLMIGVSKCQLGAVSSESYSERINSAANQVVTKYVVSTDPDFVDFGYKQHSK